MQRLRAAPITAGPSFFLSMICFDADTTRAPPYFLSFLRSCSLFVEPCWVSFAAFFSRAKTASTIGTMVFFICLFPYFAVEPNGTPASSRRAACLLPPTCLALGTLAFAEFEDSGEVNVSLLKILRICF